MTPEEMREHYIHIKYQIKTDNIFDPINLHYEININRHNFKINYTVKRFIDTDINSNMNSDMLVEYFKDWHDRDVSSDQWVFDNLGKFDDFIPSNATVILAEYKRHE